jgi:DNA polymerase sigma
MSEQYTSIRLVLSKLHRHPLLSDVSLETAVDYCIDFMRITGVPQMFIDKISVVTLNNYKANLPLDFIDLI